jgi:hypothetical protein
MQRTPIRLGVVLGSLAFLQAAHSQVSFSTTDISGNTWQYDYTITNNTAINPIGELTVFYALGQYSNLMVESSPGNWSSIVSQPDPGLPADGFFDAQALDNGLASGTSQGGFAVQFTWLGQGTPGAQPFDIVDPNTFTTLASGYTTQSGGATQAPEFDSGSTAAALGLLLGSLAVLSGRKRSI